VIGENDVKRTIFGRTVSKSLLENLPAVGRADLDLLGQNAACR
jgi:hypothetical protein